MPLPQGCSQSLLSKALAVAIVLGMVVPIAAARTQQLSCSPSSLHFGKVVAGQIVTLPVTMTNWGPSSVIVSSLSNNAPAFSVGSLNLPMTLAAGQKIDFDVTFTPTVTGVASGVIAFASNASNGTLNLQVSGKGVNAWALSANPTSLPFGNVAVGNNRTLPLTVINSGSTSVTVSFGRLAGTGFSVSGITLPLILDGGQSYTFNVIFAPQTPGPASANIVATSPFNPVLRVPLTGNGTAAGHLMISPATLNFGNVTVGDNATQSGTLSATGASVTLSAAASSSSEFAPAGMPFPLTLAVGQSASYTVAFSPQSAGAASGTLSFTSNAENSPTASLTGTGVQAAQHMVNLSWDPSTSQVVGYNVYRSGKTGGPYSRINSGLDPSTSYTDSTVTGGQSYYYVSTAVDSKSKESGYSNEVQATIP